MLKVTVRKERRIVDDYDTDFYCNCNEETELPEKYLKSASIRALLFCGDLILKEGKVEINIKGATVKIDSEDNGKAYITEGDKSFIKDLVNGTMKEVEQNA